MTPRRRGPVRSRAVRWSALVLLILAPAATALGATAPDAATPLRPAEDWLGACRAGPPGPVLRRGTAALLTAASLSAAVTGAVVGVDREKVPAQGLDRSGLAFAVDRRSVRARDSRYDRASNWAVGAGVLFPLAVGALSVRAEARRAGRDEGPALRTGLLRRAGLYAQASLLNDGLTLLLKHAVSRPRPVLYRRWSETEGTPRAWAFDAFPSGHASRAACAAALGIMDHLHTRSGAGWGERFAVGLAGGALAGGTAALRVESGEHFPTDAAAGLLLGTACGAGVPLLHGFERPDGTRARPRRADWLAAWGGYAAGLAATAVAFSATGP